MLERIKNGIAMSAFYRRDQERTFAKKRTVSEFKRRILNAYRGSEFVQPESVGDNYSIDAIEIGSYCNLNCRMCQTQDKKRDNIDMSLDTFNKSLDLVLQKGQNSICLHTINEPLASKNLEMYLKALRKKRVAAHLSTNGILLDKKMDLLFRYADTITGVRISADGASPETYEKIREPAKFQKLVDNIELFVRENKKRMAFGPLRIGSILNSVNLHEFAEYFHFFKKYTAISNIYFSLINGASPDPTYFLETNLFKKHVVSHFPNCPTLSSILEILADGRFSHCCRDYHGDLATYSIDDEYDLDQVLDHEKLKRLRRVAAAGAVPKKGICATCYVVDPRVLDLFNAVHDQLKKGIIMGDKPVKTQRTMEQFVAMCQDGIPESREVLALVEGDAFRNMRASP